MVSIDKEGFINYLQSIFENKLGERFDEDSLEEIYSELLLGTIDFILHHEGNQLDFNFGDIILTEDSLEIIPEISFEDIKGYYYVKGGDSLDTDVLNEFYTEEDEIDINDKVGDVDFTKDRRKSEEDIPDITDFDLSEEF